jgi:hypothetical protein
LQSRDALECKEFEVFRDDQRTLQESVDSNTAVRSHVRSKLLIVLLVGTLVLVYDLVQFRRSLKKDAVTNATIVGTRLPVQSDNDGTGSGSTGG